MSDEPEELPAEPADDLGAGASSSLSSPSLSSHRPSGGLEPTPLSTIPTGLAPSPGLKPPPGMAPPEIRSPQSFESSTPSEARTPADADAADPAPPTGTKRTTGVKPMDKPDRPTSPEPNRPTRQSVQTARPTKPTPRTRPDAQKKRRIAPWMTVGIVTGAIALASILIGVLAAVGGSSASDDTGKQTAAGTVERFLTALSESDAETARSLSDDIGTGPMLTDEVLARSNELAPITDISVPGPEEESSVVAVVEADYRVGEVEEQSKFVLFKSDDEWSISNPLVDLNIDSFRSVKPTLNGVEIDQNDFTVFPGAYELELGYDSFEVDATPSASYSPEDGFFVVTSYDEASELHSAEPALTDQAVETYRSLLRSSLQECARMTDLVTPCGLDVSEALADGSIPVPGSAVRTITDDGEAAISNAEPQVENPALTRYTSYDYIPIETSIEADLNGERVRGDLFASGDLLRPSVDFATEKPTLTWE